MKLKQLLFLLIPFLVSCNNGTDFTEDTPVPENAQAEPTAKTGDTRILRSTELEKPTATTTLCFENFPIIDGSDSTEPLRMLLMCRLLGIDCEWVYDNWERMTWRIWPGTIKFEELSTKFWCYNTHGSFLKLIKGESDIIITARGISRDEIKTAEAEGVELLSRPIAKDAFVFIVNSKNPVRSLSVEQIKRIYMGEITNWSEVGGNDAAIKAYCRDPNSGSQEKMETVVMEGLTMPSWAVLPLWSMIAPYKTLARDVDGICFTPFYFYDSMVRPNDISLVTLDGVTPEKSTIANGTYPYVTEVMVSVRADVDRASTAYQLFYQLATGKHNEIIDESGYISIPSGDSSTGIRPVRM